MSTTSTVHTAEVHAWLSSSAEIDGLFDAPSDRVVAALLYSTQGPGEGGFYEREGLTYLGTASITIKIGSRDHLVDQKVTALRAERQSVLADAQVKALRIERKIQTLLAISHEPRAEGGAA